MQTNELTMNTPKDKPEEMDEIEVHYDFDYQKAKVNRFAERLQDERVMVVLDADVADIFPTSEAVNSALRVIASAIGNLPMPRSAKRRAKHQPSVS